MRRASLPRLVATDLDGTLLRSDGTCSERTRDALTAAEQAGIAVVLVTARPPRWLHDLADLVGEHGIVLCANGAFVYDVNRRRILHERCMPAGVAAQIAQDLRNAMPGIAFAVESRLGFRREREFRGATIGEAMAGSDVGAAIVEELLDPLPGKMLARCDGMPPERFHRLVEHVVGDLAVVSFSGASGLAEISALGVTKASALGEWCGAQGIDAADVYAFGDMPNDLPMLEWAGRSFGVANAHPDVLALVDEVCASNDDDGVAQVLEVALGHRTLDRNWD